MRWLMCVLMATTLLVSACGNNLGMKKDNPSIAVIDWQKALQAHPQYKKLQQAEQAVNIATRLRDEQLTLGKKQLQLLDRMSNMKKTGKANYLQAEFTTRMAEREKAENERLQKLAREAEKTADQELAENKEAVEEKYRLPIVNLRIKLESVKMTASARADVAKELNEVLLSRENALAGIRQERDALVNAKMAPEITAVHKALAKYAHNMQAELMRKSMGISGSTEEQMKQGPAELEKLIASMDKQIVLKRQAHDKLLDSMNSDIASALKKVTLHKKYTLVLKNVRANISAVDVTDDVCTEIKNIAN
ncbi:MAG: hypothetical protein PHR07_05090 [Acidaminococcaceae bacterium]|nr:hypothetical protein [Acidaminococcaceae bacterium]